MRISIKKNVVRVSCIVIIGIIVWYGHRIVGERFLLKEIIKRLEAQSRVAEVIVTEQNMDPLTKCMKTTIKFLEYDACQKPLPAKYFAFLKDIIQFQSLVVRFDVAYVERGHSLKGKSIYLFMKVFALDKEHTEIYVLNETGAIPEGYKVKGGGFEERVWTKFWTYALNEKEAEQHGIKNVQIEAPVSKFVPGYLYTVNIEHYGV